MSEVGEQQEDGSTEHTVYLLGAGFNRVLQSTAGFRPPLASNLFEVALSSPHLDWRIEGVSDLFEFIEHYWKLTPEKLATVPFDLEACLTFIDEQRNEAMKRGDSEEFDRLSRIFGQVVWVLGVVLSEFSLNNWNDLEGTVQMEIFVRAFLGNPSASVITLNYDTILERAIEIATWASEKPPSLRGREPGDDIPDELLAYSQWDWNRPLGYGVEFDVVQLQQPGPSEFVPRKRFYSHPANTLYQNRVLKLHGSLNWYQRTGRRARPALSSVGRPSLPAALLEECILADEFLAMISGQAVGGWPLDVMGDGWEAEPLIVPPILRKTLPPFVKQVWTTARQDLQACSQLVVIGYSFPPTDFHVRRLLLECFADHSLSELVVVNPDTSVIAVARDLTHFRGAVQTCSTLEEFHRSRGIRVLKQADDGGYRLTVEGLGPRWVALTHKDGTTSWRHERIPKWKP